MIKPSKLSTGLMTAALIALTAPVAAFASGWVAEGDSWYYVDSSGDYVTDTWKSYNGSYFYLGSDGEMMTDSLIEDGDNYYYVDANGAMVKNTWVAIPADADDETDVSYRWYYFSSSGKAYKSTVSKTINGAVYGFDDEGRMLFGFVDDNGEMMTDVDDAVLSATYYFGTNDDGARVTGWLKYEEAIDDSTYSDDYDYDYYWFYFGSNGKKLTDTTKKINGFNYLFDENGVMLVEWADASTGVISATTSRYYSANLEDGSLQKNVWIWTEAPESWGIDDDDEHWFHTDNSGYLITDQTKKINSKWYVFDADGIMRAGLAVLSGERVNGSTLVETLDQDVVSASDIYAIDTGYIYYFSDDEETDGSMKTGTIKLSLADDDYTFAFNSSTGKAYTGVVSSKVYRNGILQKATSDEKYVIAYGGAGDDIATYLVNTTGKAMSAGKYYKNGDDTYYVVLSGNNTDGYEIVEAATLEEAKALLS